MLIEKQKDGTYKYFVSNAAPDTPIKKMINWAHERWKVEQGYQHLKEELGFDHFEGRSWRGLHHHITLCFMAYAFLVLLKRQRLKKSVRLTLPEVRRQLNKLFQIIICPYCEQY